MNALRVATYNLLHGGQDDGDRGPEDDRAPDHYPVVVDLDVSWES